MSATSLRGPIPSDTTSSRRALERLRRDPGYQSFTLLRIGFAVLPIAMGAGEHRKPNGARPGYGGCRVSQENAG